MSSVVLDASALLAVIHREAGADRVVPRLEGSVMSAVNYAEVLKKLVERGASIDGARQQVEYLSVPVRPFDREQAVRTAAMWPLAREYGLSLGDRACLALGMVLRVPILTADTQMGRLKLPVEVTVIRGRN